VRHVLIWLMQVLIGGFVGRYVLRRRGARLRERSAVDCQIRVLSGEVPGLAGRWRNGTATVSAGNLDFAPRRPKDQRVRISVTAVDHVNPRPPVGAERLLLPQSARILQVAAGASTLEWAVPEENLQWALDQVMKWP
jgi:hypothetical protein